MKGPHTDAATGVPLPPEDGVRCSGDYQRSGRLGRLDALWTTVTETLPTIPIATAETADV